MCTHTLLNELYSSKISTPELYFQLSYRLSRAERSIGCACGIVCAKWKCLLNTLKHTSSMQPELSKLYASFIILCWNMVALTQFSCPAQHCFSIVPRVSVKNF
jgi:hypothetical protein